MKKFSIKNSKDFEENSRKNGNKKNHKSMMVRNPKIEKNNPASFSPIKRRGRNSTSSYNRQRLNSNSNQEEKTFNLGETIDFEEDYEEEYDEINKCGIFNHKLLAFLSIMVKLGVLPFFIYLFRDLRNISEIFEYYVKGKCSDHQTLEIFRNISNGFDPLIKTLKYLCFTVGFTVVIDIPTLCYNLKKPVLDDEEEERRRVTTDLGLDKTYMITRNPRKSGVKNNLESFESTFKTKLRVQEEELTRRKKLRKFSEHVERRRRSTDVNLDEKDIAMLNEYSDYGDSMLVEEGVDKEE